MSPHLALRPPGYYGNDVYERGGQLDDIPKGATYLGCFRDAIKDRVLTLKMTTSDKMDYDVSKAPVPFPALIGLDDTSPSSVGFFCQMQRVKRDAMHPARAKLQRDGHPHTNPSSCLNPNRRIRLGSRDIDIYIYVS